MVELGKVEGGLVKPNYGSGLQFYICFINLAM